MTIAAAIQRARVLATGDAAWRAVDELAAVWRDTRDPDLGAQLCALGEELAPAGFSLRGVLGWTLRDLEPTGALLEAIVAHVRGLVAHDPAVADFLRLVSTWPPDPRLAHLALQVLGRDSARRGARQAAAELFSRNADQRLHAQLRSLADTTVPVLRAELAGLVERCALPPSTPLTAEQHRAVAEAGELLRARLAEARAQVVRDVTLAISAQQEVERAAKLRR